MRLPSLDRQQFMIECAQALSIAEAEDQCTALANLINDWRTTADIHSDPDLVSILSAPIPEPLDLMVG